MIGIKRKSQGMPVNVIIIAVLALIVLVVLTVIFTSRVKIFSSTLDSCSAKQGQCDNGPLCSGNKALITNTDCKKPQVCCVQVLNP